MACLSYVLFLIPLIEGSFRTSTFVKFHLNQAILIFAAQIAYTVISSVLRSIIKVDRYVLGIPYTITPGWLSTILTIGSLALFVFSIYGIINALNLKKVKIPVIGDLFTFIK